MVGGDEELRQMFTPSTVCMWHCHPFNWKREWALEQKPTSQALFLCDLQLSVELSSLSEGRVLFYAPKVAEPNFSFDKCSKILWGKV